MASPPSQDVGLTEIEEELGAMDTSTTTDLFTLRQESKKFRANRDSHVFFFFITRFSLFLQVLEEEELNRAFHPKYVAAEAKKMKRKM